MFRSKWPFSAGVRRPAATLALSATDVEMASQPRRRFFADGLHRAEKTETEDSVSLTGGDHVALLNSLIFKAEGVEYSHIPIAGSVYRALAFGVGSRAGAGGCGDGCLPLLQNFAFYIVFVQIIAPPLMLWYAVKHIDWSKSRVTFVATDLGQGADAVEKILVLTLGYIFLVPFLANLAVCCKKNMEDYVRLRAVSLYLTEQGDFEVCMCGLTLGCLVHCLITPMIMIVTWYLTATSSSPIDITMNMLGLAFVANMDQLAADFADTLGYFVWDDQKTGDFVYDTLKGRSLHVGDDEYQIDDPDDVSQFPKPWWCCAFDATNWGLMITILLVFSFYKVVEVESGDITELAALKATVADLELRLNKLAN